MSPVLSTRDAKRGMPEVSRDVEVGVGDRATEDTGPREWDGKRLRVTTAQLESFTRNIQTQIGAGVPLVRALEVEATQEEEADIGIVTGEILDSIRGGSSFAESLGMFPSVFPPVYRNLVRAGEYAGSLEPLLDDLCDYLEWQDDVTRTVKRAMRYPILVVSATYLLCLFLLSFVIPRFGDLFRKMGDDLPAYADLLLTAGRFCEVRWLTILGVTVGLCVAFVYSLRYDAWKRTTYRLLLRIPLFGSVFRSIDMARLTRGLAVLTGAGIPLVQGLELCRDSVSAPDFSDSIGDIREDLLEGVSFSESLDGSEAFPPLVVGMASVGEEAGRLPETMQRLATHYDRESKEHVARALGFLEPAVTLALGLIVGGLAVMVITTLYKAMLVAGR